MPTYDYLCDKCGHQFEVFQMMSDKPLKKCPECRSKIRRLIGGGAGILFKGSGFYQTDYRSSKYKESASKDSKPAKSAEKIECGSGSCKSPQVCN